MHVAGAPDGDVVLSHEHTDFTWLSIDEYALRYCSDPPGAPEWVKAFLAEMRQNCDAFRVWLRAKAGP